MGSEQSRSKSNWKFMVEIFKMFYKKATSTKEDLVTAIRESWNHFDKEYRLK